MYEKSRKLLDCHIAGFTYYDGLDVIESLTLGTPVTLRSEPDNPCDPEAVAIYYKESKLGYIPQAKNNFVSQLLYFGYSDILEARINSNNPMAHPENQYRIVVKIKDNRNG
ncbi:MAG: HIRAN domain-containing protein [Clostridia bacterium]|nr:HIRAN domain-containing protein [Clostridia bacterium]